LSEIQDKQFIFVISQPRSGSTLLQSLLNNHPQIGTLPEPWLLLPLISPLRPIASDVAHDEMSAKAIANFLAALPDKKQAYYDGLRQMSSYLYAQAMQTTKARFFVDKTPRYYHILPEIRQVFPKALIIILLRNPLAVLNSMLNRKFREKGKQIWRLWFNRHDLLDAPHTLLRAITSPDDNTLLLRYEQLVEDQSVLNIVYNHLDIPPPAEIDKFLVPQSEGIPYSGDHKIRQDTQIVTKRSSQWIEELDDPQKWRFAHDYLIYLGGDTISAMGYDFDELRHIIESKRPSSISRAKTMPLLWLLNQPDEETIRRTWHYRFYRLMQKL
jgi:sulfotransferase family protein